MNNVRQLNREDVLEKVARKDNNTNRVRAIFRFDSRLPNLSAILRRKWQTMIDDDRRLLGAYPSHQWYATREGRT